MNDSSSIFLSNPSFEGYENMGPTPIEPPAICHVTDIKGWRACSELGKRLGFYRLPEDLYSYSIVPQHGRHYLGMEVASDSTWDCIMQKLSQPIIANKNYKMSFWLAASKNYPHLIDNKGIMTENKPAFLQIWGLNVQDGFSELLYSTSEVTNAQWEKQEIAFSPMLDYDHIQFKPCYAQEGEVYNGNILLDNLSAIEYIGE